MLSGQQLHRIGMKGKGITIAILDGGFQNADKIPAIQHVNIVGTKDFVYPNSPFFYQETDHGTKVLSAMGVNEPEVLVGTAPEAFACTNSFARRGDLRNSNHVKKTGRISVLNTLNAICSSLNTRYLSSCFTSILAGFINSMASGGHSFFESAFSTITSYDSPFSTFAGTTASTIANNRVVPISSWKGFKYRRPLPLFLQK